MTTHPTDKELEAFAIEEQFLLFCDEDEFTQIARAVLAKWGAPAQAAPAAVARPSDLDLLAEWYRVSTIAEAGERRLAVMRAVLAKWGAAPTTQPAPQPSPASQADSQPALDEATAMNQTRELAESGRWPSDWVEAYRRGYSDRAARDPAGSVTAPAGGVNWQDISTAPKDGTRFVAVGQNYGLDSEGQHTCIAQWFRGCWMDVSEWNETSELKYLTHWMPLPPLPCSAARAPADSVLEDAALPMQPICVASDGVVRFKKNRMVNDMYEFSQPRGFGLNEMARGDYTQEERMQFAQLIGYSVSGYGSLSYASSESVEKADAIADLLIAARKQGENHD